LAPRLLVFDHCIQHHNHLPHAGNDGDFWDLSLVLQVFIEAFEHRVALDR